MSEEDYREKARQGKENAFRDLWSKVQTLREDRGNCIKWDDVVKLTEGRAEYYYWLKRHECFEGETVYKQYAMRLISEEVHLLEEDKYD
jgi:hypothetical protein